MISDHQPQFCTISEFTCDYHNLAHKFNDYSHFDANAFLVDNAECSFSSSDLHSDLNEKFAVFAQPTWASCPQTRLSKIKFKLKSKPWTNQCILKMMKIRDKLLKRFKVTNSTDDLRLFKHFRNRVVKELKECKRIHYHQYFDKNKGNMKML